MIIETICASVATFILGWYSADIIAFLRKSRQKASKQREMGDK